MRQIYHKLTHLFLTLLTLTITSATLLAQTGEVRGFVYDRKTGVEVPFANVTIKGTVYGTSTDENGFYAIANVKPGKYTLFCTAIGFDSTEVEVIIAANKYITKNIYISEGVEDLDGVVIDNTDPSKPWEPITTTEILHIPPIGEADIVQYLQILPGVITSGDQGGQLYIRGGSPIMNKVLLDGMTIYNPFHSIGLFSVFDADILKTTDVYSAAFGAEYGGRISAIMDVKTRDGNKNHLAGKLSSNTFSSKILLEGPLKKFKEGEGSTSFILTYKNSYLDKSANTFYKYANPENLPYSFSDLYGKISIDSRNGSKVNLFGFNYNDRVAFDVTEYKWKSTGLGGKFLLIPDGSKNIIDGFFAFSNYDISQTEKVLSTDESPKPRRSSIGGFNVGLNFNYFLKKDHLKWGLEMNGFKTDFEFYNSANRRIGQVNNTTELSGFLNYKHKTDKYYIEPGLRVQVYASLGNTSVEPRLNFRYFISDRLTFRAGAGLYSQNLLSSISDRDVVNLFYGFLSGPDELPKKVGDKEITQKIQKAKHAIAGIEYKLSPKSNILIESYVKDFGQIININRDKIFDDNIENNDGVKDPPDYLKKDFVVETGLAYGADFRYKYESKHWYLWGTYSYTYVSRYDGIRTYHPHFDRRHNVNLVAAYTFGKNDSWEFNTRWSYGSGFPFTKTQGFYENLGFSQGVSTDYTSTNGQLGIQYADLNTGRQPEFHRLDASISKTIKFKRTEMEGDKTVEKETGILNITASCTNIYNRENIFYFNRVEYKRINQLPILPSVGLSYTF